MIHYPRTVALNGGFELITFSTADDEARYRMRVTRQNEEDIERGSASKEKALLLVDKQRPKSRKKAIKDEYSSPE